MTNLLQRIGVGLTISTLLSMSLASSAFAATITVSGNGNGSTNVVNTKDICKTSVKQTNSTSVGTFASVSASTGGNEIEGNTGGSSTISTGDATAGVSVSVEGGSNTATPPSCCACLEGGAPDVAITDNGNGSTNVVTDTKKQKTTVTQKNKVKVWTFAKVKAKTGGNELENNTGSGSSVTTGNSEAGLDVSVTAPSNSTP